MERARKSERRRIRPTGSSALKPGPRKLRLGAAWVLALAFLWLATPTSASLVAGAAVVVVGLLLRGWAAGVLEKDRELAISGPYAYTRNPLYMGSFVIGVGGAIAGDSLWFGLLFVAFFTWMYGSAMARESLALTKHFGAGYRDYHDSVPTFLPSATRYRPPSTLELRTRSFSAARYLRNREYEALLGALAAFGLLALKAAGWPGPAG